MPPTSGDASPGTSQLRSYHFIQACLLSKLSLRGHRLSDERRLLNRGGRRNGTLVAWAVAVEPWCHDRSDGCVFVDRPEGFLQTDGVELVAHFAACFG